MLQQPFVRESSPSFQSELQIKANNNSDTNSKQDEMTQIVQYSDYRFYEEERHPSGLIRIAFGCTGTRYTCWITTSAFIEGNH